MVNELVGDREVCVSISSSYSFLVCANERVTQGLDSDVIGKDSLRCVDEARLR